AVEVAVVEGHGAGPAQAVAEDGVPHLQRALHAGPLLGVLGAGALPPGLLCLALGALLLGRRGLEVALALAAPLVLLPLVPLLPIELLRSLRRDQPLREQLVAQRHDPLLRSHYYLAVPAPRGTGPDRAMSLLLARPYPVGVLASAREAIAPAPAGDVRRLMSLYEL